MDPVTHTLVGAALARTRLGRLGGLARGLAGTVLVAGANLPDVDVATYFVSGDFALEHRRGWTHGLLAMAMLPLLLAGLALAWDRLRRRREHPATRARRSDPAARARSPDPAAGAHAPGSAAGARVPASFGPLLALAAIAVWSHPLLDWLNTYGVRLLAPFDWTWFYGDAVFIVDPWLWLVLGGALVLGRWRSPERAAVVGLALAALYVGALVASTAAGEALVRDALKRGAGRQVERMMVGPEAVDPFHRQVVVETSDGYRLGRLSWLERARVDLELGIVPAPWHRPAGAPRREPGPELTAPVRAALAAPGVRGFVTWARFPTFVVAPTGEGATVHLIDLRYARRPESGFGTARVELDAELRPIPP
jgi:inner membrane protein